MSIIIKGMEMPKDRPQLLWVYPNGKAMTVQSDVDPWKELQAVYVTPHGRLIDADALIRRIDAEADKFMVMNEYDSGLRMGYWAAKKVANLAPTIIPAEEGE